MGYETVNNSKHNFENTNIKLTGSFPLDNAKNSFNEINISPEYFLKPNENKKLSDLEEYDVCYHIGILDLVEDWRLMKQA